MTTYNSTLVNTPAMSFSITGGSPMEGTMVGTSCGTDWITIPCATNSNDPTAQIGTPNTCVDRICGMVFNSIDSNAAGDASMPVNSEWKENCPTKTKTFQEKSKFSLSIPAFVD